ncbi:hypothetical protein M440DRAFT_1398648 [Trichoderma longibrachiatum ATCC 18648]|uniref:Uncharacterized protein n=1 Tax=Trichoderma longibrachiatum ATCC 18648 TaxID=983965 RepID=A0A2T4CCW8_TRILO|nr:hypothetical protein M440DRAFT_1398648 [Trichoderma longibrachiatum ATCC 18648]
MEATLLSSLHTKLDDLEGKMRAYRCDLLSDFQHYYHDLLAGVPPSIAASVQRAIVQSFANYPTLRPELEPAVADSQPPHSPAFQQLAARNEPPGTPTITSREREAELQGLFTPSYLPLLDSSPPSKYDSRSAAPSPVASMATATASTTTTATQTTAAVSSPPVMAPPAVRTDSGSGTAPNHGITEGGLATAGNDTPPAEPHALTEAHHLVRTATEESTSSVNSDRSDAKTRRSALRRSSSTSKPPQSPRRVRFEVMGTEVLPTSSPQQVEFLTPVASPPALEDDPIASGMILGDDMDWEPPVRKSSSTEALRALSRAPAEEGTVWTVVNPDTDEVPSHPNNTTAGRPLVKPTSAELITPTANHHTSTIPSGAAQASNTTSSYSDDVNDRGSENDDDDGNSSDDEDDYLAMPKRSSSGAGKPASASLTQMPPKRAVNGHSAATSLPNRSTTGSSNSSNHRDRNNPPSPADGTMIDDGDDDDELFEFEPGGLSAPPKPRERPPPPPDDDDDDDDLSDASQDDVPNMDRPGQQGLYSTSPAVPIMRPARFDNSSSTVSRFQPGSLGSYKGRPVIMPVVRNPEVHARAASLGNFNTFVGGLDGRSGMDEADLSSFRASFVRSGFTGTPRSFTERFMMEEAQAQAQSEKESNGSIQ